MRSSIFVFIFLVFSVACFGARSSGGGRVGSARGGFSAGGRSFSGGRSFAGGGYRGGYAGTFAGRYGGGYGGRRFGFGYAGWPAYGLGFGWNAYYDPYYYGSYDYNPYSYDPNYYVSPAPVYGAYGYRAPVRFLNDGRWHRFGR